MDHFEKLDRRAHFSNKNYTEVSPEEVKKATDEMDALYFNVVEAFKDDVVDVFRVGSSFWGRNFSLRGKENKEPSDLDVEIIFDSFPTSFLNVLEKNEIALVSDFQEKVKNGEADYLVVKKNIGGVDVSFHFTPLATFNKICNFSYESVSNDIFLREFRIVDNIKPKKYIQKNFAGDGYIFETFPDFINGVQISEIPLVGTGNYGELILGTTLNKYLPLPDLVNSDARIEEGLECLVSSLRSRKNVDQDIMHSRDLSFKYFHYASNRMPEDVIEALGSLD